MSNKLDQENDDEILAVSFNHIITLWRYNQNAGDGVLFLGDLIHCDSNDPIKHLKFVNNNNLLVAHTNFLNLWNIKLPNKAVDASDESLLKNLSNNIQFNCTWSQQTSSDVLFICENPVEKEKLIVFTSKMQLQINEETSTTIQGLIKIFFYFQKI
jgi:hypothetical protein